MKKTNYHTHSQYCDGKSTAREMILAAIDCNMDILGFSSHSMYPHGGDWHIAQGNHQEYINHILSLKEEFKDKIEICTGFEADFIEGKSKPDFEIYKDLNPDYLIGSVHYVPGNGGCFEADGPQETTKKNIQLYFNGNIKEAVCAYFAAEREMLKNCSFTILGHCDLITLQNKNNQTLFDTNEEWYKKELIATAEEIARAGVIAEVNTGGMARSGLTLPYPQPYFIELLHSKNIPVTINSDAHRTDGIDYWFDEAVQYIKKAGYKELAFISNKKICFQNI